MSWGHCYSGSNNIHFDFPPIMEDGRNFANWIPSCEINEKVRVANGITSNFQYRMFLTQNADSLIKQNQKDSCDQCCACVYHTGVPANTGKYLYKSCADSTRPFGYEDSDLKNSYLSSQQLNMRLKAPIMSQFNYLLMPRDK